MERKFYKIEAYTGFDGEVMVEYYSTGSERHLQSFSEWLVGEVAEFAYAHYPHEAKPGESEEEYYKRFAKNCGARIHEITAEEYYDAKNQVWCMV